MAAAPFFAQEPLNQEADVQSAAERFGPVFLCPYRANGRTHTARIRAKTSRQAASKMAAIDWAPDCGPIGTPRLLKGAQSAHGSKILSVIDNVVRRSALRWA